MHTQINLKNTWLPFAILVIALLLFATTVLAGGDGDSSSGESSPDTYGGGDAGGSMSTEQYLWCDNLNGAWVAPLEGVYGPPPPEFSAPGNCASQRLSCGPLTLTQNGPETAMIAWWGATYNPMEHWSVDGQEQGGPIRSGQTISLAAFGAGNHTIRVWSDPGELVGKYCAEWGVSSDSSGNYMPVCTQEAEARRNYSCEVSYTAPATPDLVSENMAIAGGSTTITYGQSYQFTANVRNTSTATTASFSDSFAYSYDGQNGSFVEIPPAVSVNGLSGSASHTDTSGTISFATPGTVTIRHCADSGNSVSESDEGNNCSYRSYTIQGSPILAQCSVSPTTIVEEGNATWTATASGGATPYSYQWSGADDLSGSGTSVVKTYSTTGTKNASVLATDALGLQSGWIDCSLLTVTETPGVTANLQARILGSGGAWSNGPIIINDTEEVELRWTSTNASSCIGDTYYSTGGATSGTTGAVSEPDPATSRQYHTTCTGSGDSASDTVTVLRGTSLPSLTVNPDRVRSGESVNITATLNGQTGCVITGRDIDPQNGDGDGDANTRNLGASNWSGSTGPILGETTFSLSCATGGTAEAIVRLLVSIEHI